jgi:hypothetical protein
VRTKERHERYETSDTNDTNERNVLPGEVAKGIREKQPVD